MNNKRIFLFGAAKKGALCTPLRFDSLSHLAEDLGEPPEDSIGIDYAIQTLLLNREVIFFRVREEGFAKEDYWRGVKLLYNHGEKLKLCAICIPGVGDKEIIESLAPLSQRLRSILILSEKDLYDYLTGSKY